MVRRLRCEFLDVAQEGHTQAQPVELYPSGGLCISIFRPALLVRVRLQPLQLATGEQTGVILSTLLSVVTPVRLIAFKQSPR